jgi:hypothetical protein
MRYRTVPSFLRTTEAAAKWAEKNIDTSLFDEPDPIEENRYEYAPGLWERADAYVDFARHAYREGSVTVWRAVKIPLGTTPNFQCLGKAWSYERHGAGVYGLVPHKGELETVVLEGRVRAQDIDWAYGFTSFVYYGEDQSEVSMHDHSPVLVTRMTGVERRKEVLDRTPFGALREGVHLFDPPVRGMTGTTRGDIWRPGCDSPVPKVRAAWRRASF